MGKGLVTSKSGKLYYNYYERKPPSNEPEKTVWLTSKQGNLYRGYPRKTVNNPRLRCLRRDNYTCQLCGVHISKQKLHVHHRDGKSYPGVKRPNNDLENLITLCSKCHPRLHSKTYFRLDMIKKLRADGETYQAIGNLLHVSRQRIHQLLLGENS